MLSQKFLKFFSFFKKMCFFIYFMFKLPWWFNDKELALSMQEMWVQSLGQDGSLEKGTATHSRILAWRIPWTEGAWWAVVHGIAKESDMT